METKDKKDINDEFLKSIMPNLITIINSKFKQVCSSPINKIFFDKTEHLPALNNCNEEFIFDIFNIDKRLVYEESFLTNYEEQIQLIRDKENHVTELKSKLNDNQTSSFNEFVDEIAFILKTCVNQMIRIMNNKYLSDYRNELSSFYIKYFNILKNSNNNNNSLYIKYFNNINNNNNYNSNNNNNIDIPSFNEIFKLKKDEIKFPGIDTRYNDYKTAIHNEACKIYDKNYNNNIVTLIKLGANISLKDNMGKTPLDFIDDNKINKIYSIMEKELYINGCRNCYIPRIKRVLVEIQLRKYGDLEEQSYEDYFNSIINFVKYYRNKRNKEEIENSLSNLLWHDENIDIRKKREDYFLKLKNNKGLNQEGMTNDGKKWKGKTLDECKKYNQYIIDKPKFLDEIHLINEYFIERNNIKFNNYKNNIKQELEILNNNIYSEGVIKCMEEDIERFFMEYPSQIDMELNNNTDILEEAIDHNYIKLLKVLSINGKNLNYVLRDGKLPLEKAVDQNNLNLVKRLIDLGASLELKTQNGEKLVELIKNKFPEFYKKEHFVTKNETIENLLQTKEENVVINIIKEKGLDIDTSLKKAIEETKQLIRLGADMRKADNLIKSLLKDNLCGNKMNKFISGLKEEYEVMMNEAEVRNYYSLASDYIKNEDFNKVVDIHSKCKDIYKYQKEGELNLLTQMIIKTNYKNIEKLKEIIENQKEIINIENAVNKINGTTPVHYIMEKIKIDPTAIEILKMFLGFITEENINLIDKKNNDGISVLDYAIALNNIEAIKLIYQKIVDLKPYINNRVDNIIHIQYALFNNNITIKELKNIITKIISIRKNGDTLLTIDDVINDNSIENSQTILHITSYLGRLDIINGLYGIRDININFDVTDKWGRTPIFYAVISQKNDIINYFKDKKDNNGKTALHYAAYSKNKAILTYFGDNGNLIDFYIKDDNGLRAVDYLLLGEIDEEMKIIIRNYINQNDINNKNNDQFLTNLYIACENKINPNEAIEIILERREADLTNLLNVPLEDRKFLQKRLDNETPLQIALSNNVISDETIIKLIDKSNILNINGKMRNDLIKLLTCYQKEDIAVKLNIKKEFNSILMNSTQLICKKIISSNNENEIKEILNIDNTIDCKDFNLYDYAIVKDRYDLYCEFIKLEKDIDIDKIKKRVIEFNALNILYNLLNKNEEYKFNENSLWEIASNKAKKIIIQYYKKNNILEEEVREAAYKLNIKLVSLGIKYNGKNERIKGL
ncbi:hypothetical protein PIROE2DRAFT_61598 [Piromyces sp. E2]|nr:hypothetical protein PIROE2DRAFT_61598 [Piromyces sp. E2]|eukprot:OUM62889.1 hypothetical protein PIROE2DRAFT_61598 [Piromyces sp. E2]